MRLKTLRLRANSCAEGSLYFKDVQHSELLNIRRAVLSNQSLSPLQEEWDPSEDPKAPVGTVWHNNSYLYMPAPPGRSPTCARGGMTYCNSIPTYPR